MCECEDINIYIHSIYTCMYNCLFCICIPKTKKGTNSAHNSKRIRSFSCLGFCVLSLSLPNWLNGFPNNTYDNVQKSLTFHSIY